MNVTRSFRPLTLLGGLFAGLFLLAGVALLVIAPVRQNRVGARIVRNEAYDGDVICNATYDHPEELEQALNAGGDPNAISMGGDPCLMLAAHNGNTLCVRILLAHGANPNAKGTQGATPLRHAVFCHHIAIVKHLLAHGADPNLADDEGKTPLHSARKHGFSDMEALLIKAGAK